MLVIMLGETASSEQAQESTFGQALFFRPPPLCAISVRAPPRALGHSHAAVLASQSGAWSACPESRRVLSPRECCRGSSVLMWHFFRPWLHVTAVGTLCRSWDTSTHSLWLVATGLSKVFVRFGQKNSERHQPDGKGPGLCTSHSWGARECKARPGPADQLWSPLESQPRLATGSVGWDPGG